jgi:vacuolar-type H+-ATPase subunit H
MVERLSPDDVHSSREDLCPEILGRINAREQEIERTLLEARQTAAERLREARRLAETVLAGHQVEAAGEVADLQRERVAEARRAADAILAAAVCEASAIRAVPPERLELVAARLLAMILPGGGSARAGS